MTLLSLDVSQAFSVAFYCGFFSVLDWHSVLGKKSQIVFVVDVVRKYTHTRPPPPTHHSYVYMCTYVCVYMHVCVHVYTRIWACVRKHICTLSSVVLFWTWGLVVHHIDWGGDTENFCLNDVFFIRCHPNEMTKKLSFWVGKKESTKFMWKKKRSGTSRKPGQKDVNEADSAVSGLKLCSKVRALLKHEVGSFDYLGLKFSCLNRSYAAKNRRNAENCLGGGIHGQSPG